MQRVNVFVVSVIMAVTCLNIASAQVDKNVMAKGQKVFLSYCSTCHQTSGTGLGSVYPPLANSDYLKRTSVEQVIKDVVNGKSGPLKVNGRDFNGVMASLPKRFTDADAAAVITYVYNTWNNPKTIVSEQQVKKVRKR